MQDILRHHPIGHYSGYRTDVQAEYFFQVNDPSDMDRLSQIYSHINSLGLPILIIGGGTNLLFASTVFPGLIVKNNLSGKHYNPDTKRLEIFSNESISDTAQWLEKTHKQELWHRFIGLPGSVGGAIVGNAGCFGLETASNFQSATVCHMPTGNIQVLSCQDMHFDYRYSFLKDHPEYFLISACFDLSKKREKYASNVDNIAFRKYHQPKGYSCGSFFKNPTEFYGEDPRDGSRPPSAGTLIERVGLKGFRYGGAYWSDLHANFLMSDGKDCAPSDLIHLVRLAQEKVQRETGYTLINEVRIIE